MALCGGHGDVGEWHAAARATEHEAATAHVSPSGKFGRKEKPLAENPQQGLDIFRRGDAAEQNDFAFGANLRCEAAGVAFQWNEVARLGGGDRRGGEGAEGFSGDEHVRGEQAAAGGDDQRSGDVRRRIGEGPGVGEFAPEVEAADKGESLAEGQLAVAEAQREWEASVFAEDQLRANAAGVGGGEEKDAAGGRLCAAARSSVGFPWHRGMIP